MSCCVLLPVILFSHVFAPAPEFTPVSAPAHDQGHIMSLETLSISLVLSTGTILVGLVNRGSSEAGCFSCHGHGGHFQLLASLVASMEAVPESNPERTLSPRSAQRGLLLSCPAQNGPQIRSLAQKGLLFLCVAHRGLLFLNPVVRRLQSPNPAQRVQLFPRSAQGGPLDPKLSPCIGGRGLHAMALQTVYLFLSSLFHY